MVRNQLCPRLLGLALSPRPVHPMFDGPGLVSQNPALGPHLNNRGGLHLHFRWGRWRGTSLPTFQPPSLCSSHRPSLSHSSYLSHFRLHCSKTAVAVPISQPSTSQPAPTPSTSQPVLTYPTGQSVPTSPASLLATPPPRSCRSRRRSWSPRPLFPG